jgi:hypothetical protein
MNFHQLLITLEELQFAKAVWVVPAATGIHFLEEATGFPDWAAKYASPRYTVRRWKIVHGLGLIYVLAFSTIISFFPNRLTVFLFFALCLTECVYNTSFHLSATVWFRVYCPGLITAAVLYPVVFWILSVNAFKQELLSSSSALLAVAVAGMIHTIDMATNLFFVSIAQIMRRLTSLHVRRTRIKRTCTPARVTLKGQEPQSGPILE